MELKSLLRADQIVFSLKSNTKKELFIELLEVLHIQGKIKNRESALKCLLDREAKLSTGMEKGLAIPHAKTDAVDRLTVVFGLHHNGLSYESLDGLPVRFIFMVLSPPDSSGPHIMALASIARCVKDDSMREALLKCITKEDIFKILTR